MRAGALPAAVVAAAVIAFVAYISFRGASHAVDYAVTSSAASVVPADSRQLPAGWRHADGQVMVVEVSWHAGDHIAAGSYAVMVAPPRGWRRGGCVPECEWTDAQGLSSAVPCGSRSGPRRTRPPSPPATRRSAGWCRPTATTSSASPRSRST